MKKIIFVVLICLVGFAFAAGSITYAQMPFAPNVPVQGQVISNVRGPVPGLTVSLVHPVLGRSAPSFTDNLGRFGWSAIPVRQEAYFLEVYWGQNLIYRQQIQVGGPTQLPTIHL